MNSCEGCGCVVGCHSRFCSVCNVEHLRLKNREKYLKRVKPCVQNRWCLVCSEILLHGELFYCADCKEMLESRKESERVGVFLCEGLV